MRMGCRWCTGGVVGRVEVGERRGGRRMGCMGVIISRRRRCRELEEGERIRQVRVEYDVWMHRVVMETSRGRMLEMGRAEPPMVRSPLVRKALLPEVQGEEYEVLAFITGVGGHIHHLGVYYHRVR